MQTEFPILLLKLLSDYPLEHFDSFIEEKLNSEYLDEVLLSLKAFQKRPIKNSWEKVCLHEIKQHDLGIIQSNEAQRARITDRGTIAGRHRIFYFKNAVAFFKSDSVAVR